MNKHLVGVSQIIWIFVQVTFGQIILLQNGVYVFED